MTERWPGVAESLPPRERELKRTREATLYLANGRSPRGSVN